MSNIIGVNRTNQFRDNSSFSISNLIIRVYFPIFLIIIASIYSYHYFILDSDDSLVIFTEEQFKYLPPSIKYQINPSPPNMPSVLLSQAEENSMLRTSEEVKYGGKFDKPHLGGFTEYDSSGLSPNVFNYMIGGLAIKSFIDVGCGKGLSTKYFLDKGLKVLCVEGSHDAVTQTVLPQNRVVEHDFSRGPWWPADTYDAAWSVEFLEHVGRQYMDNYMPIFHKSALIFVTASGWGGWHHVEIHGPWWWKTRFAMEGFIHSADLTEKIRKIADDGQNFPMPGRNKIPVIDAQHIIHGMHVYINPAVARLPKHKHLMGGYGCYDNTIENNKNGIACTGVDQLPAIYETLQNCYVKDKIQWVCEKNPNAIPQL